jgi:hypothetical protein
MRAWIKIRGRELENIEWRVNRVGGEYAGSDGTMPDV